MKLNEAIDKHIQEQRKLSKNFRLTMTSFFLRVIGSIVYRNKITSLRRSVAKSGLNWVKSIKPYEGIIQDIEIEILSRKQANAQHKERSDFITTILWLTSFVGFGSVLTKTAAPFDIFFAFASLGVFIIAILACFDKVNSLNEIQENEYVISLLETCNKKLQSTTRHVA